MKIGEIIYNVEYSKRRIAEPVTNNKVKLLWGHVIEQIRQTDSVFVEKDNKMTILIDIAVPGNTRVEEREQENRDKYQDLI